MSTVSSISIPEIRDRLSGQVIVPGDAEYDQARALFYAKFDRRPAVIIRPADAEEVAFVVSVARENGVELAVRSGGHSTAGHSVSEGGMVLDLSLLKALEIDPDGRTAWAETGLTTGEVTVAAAAHGLAVGFGDTGSVGIGGLTLGGGVGYLSRLRGLTIDNLLAAEVVTADDRLLRADENQNQDLFWAIRGGGGNFGVATRFLYRLQPLDTVIGGMLLLPATSELIASFVDLAGEAPEELSAIINIMAAPPMPFVPEEHHGELIVMALVVYAGPIEDGEKVLAPFRALATPIADMLKPMPYPQMFAGEEEFRPLAVGRTLFLDTVDRGVAETILDRIRASSAMMPVTQLRVLGGAIARVPDDATAFAHRKSQIMTAVAAIYTTPEEEQTHQAWVDEGVDALRQSDTGAYVNFVSDEGESGVRAAYPADTLKRLAEIKRRYDPTNLFRLNQNIPPA